MENYMDDSFVIANNTIIAYCGKHPVMKIPARFTDIEITRIGDGSFMESSKLQCIIAPPRTKTIGKKAFWQCPVLTSAFVPGTLMNVEPEAFGNCQMLSDITIYGMELTASEYNTFKSLGNKSSEGIYVLREMPNNELVQNLISSITTAKPACKIPDNISSLFQMFVLDEKKGKISIEKNLPLIGFTVPSVPTTENNAFFRHIKNGFPEVYDVKAEQKNDWYVRVGRDATKEKTIIFTFDDSKTRHEANRTFINATLKIGYFFWQSAQPLVYDKKKYYIYRRYYLGSNPELEYIRRDMAVYSDKGLLTNREEAKNVYAKYKLLSIL